LAGTVERYVQNAVQIGRQFHSGFVHTATFSLVREL
jgi:hypothetical protein